MVVAARIPAQRRAEALRVLVDDVHQINELVAAAARHAQHLGVPLELVEPRVDAEDHETRASLIRLMDDAVALARRAAPGLHVRIGTLPAEESPAAADELAGASQRSAK
jgi:hypothetical protein